VKHKPERYEKNGMTKRKITEMNKSRD